MVVYKVTNILNKKSYIGQTTGSVEARWKRHCGGSSKCWALNNAIKKHGAQNFMVEILVKAETIDELNTKESYFIDKFNTLSPNGYNLTVDCTNRVFCEATRKKMSKNHWSKSEGFQHPFLNKTHPESTRKKISDSLRGNIPWNKGLKMDYSYRKRISEACKGRKAWNKGECIHKVQGPDICFRTLQEAALYYNVSVQAIRLRCKRRSDWSLI